MDLSGSNANFDEMDIDVLTYGNSKLFFYTTN